MAERTEKIGIVGSGLIGRSWAMLFASVGYKVFIYDIEPKFIAAALKDVEQQLKTLESRNELRGKLTAAQQFSCIKGTTDLSKAVKDAVLVQECVPENLDLKRSVWKQVDDIAGPKTILSSSTSTFMPSLFSDHLTHKENIVVSHPVNPPYFVPLVEIVPAPWTKPEIPKKTRAIMEEIGQSPINLTKEVPGFALNRIQYAILNESFNMLKDGLLDVADMDKVMSDGLGPRYAFLGMWETTHLNAEGFENYCDRYRNSIFNVSQDFKPLAKLEGPIIKDMAQQLEKDVPLEELAARRAWRDKALTKLSLLKNELKNEK